MKSAFLWLTLAALGWAQAGAVAGSPGNQTGPRWTQSMKPRWKQRAHHSPGAYRNLSSPNTSLAGSR